MVDTEQIAEELEITLTPYICKYVDKYGKKATRIALHWVSLKICERILQEELNERIKQKGKGATVDE